MPVEDLASYVGPTPYCNWVIKGKVMAGGYPASVDDEENDELLLLLMRDYAFDTFVCLQSEVSPHATERSWRSGRAPRPYMHDIRRLMAAHKRDLPHPKVDFVHLPIVDGSVTSDAVLDRFVDDLIRRVRAGKRLYIHCWGGHGRTGTVVAIMLGRMYDVTTSQALARTQLLHDLRDEPQDVGSPSTEVQRAQVRRLLGARYGGPGDGDRARDEAPGRGSLHRGERAGYGGGYGGYVGYGGLRSRNLEVNVGVGVSTAAERAAAARERLLRRTPSSPKSPKTGGPRTPAAVPPERRWR